MVRSARTPSGGSAQSLSSGNASASPTSRRITRSTAHPPSDSASASQHAPGAPRLAPPTRNAAHTRRTVSAPVMQTFHIPPSLPAALGEIPCAQLIPIPGGTTGGHNVSGPPKKSHAKRQPAGHIPRPRNAFILFRCDFVTQKMVPASIENDHRNISRIAGHIWKQMDTDQRSPWEEMARVEKAAHKSKYPDYRYAPNAPPAGAEAGASQAPGERRSRRARGSAASSSAQDALPAASPVADNVVAPVRTPTPAPASAAPAATAPALSPSTHRSSSCPPPASTCNLGPATWSSPHNHPATGTPYMHAANDVHPQEQLVHDAPPLAYATSSTTGHEPVGALQRVASTSSQHVIEKPALPELQIQRVSSLSSAYDSSVYEPSVNLPTHAYNTPQLADGQPKYFPDTGGLADPYAYSHSPDEAVGGSFAYHHPTTYTHPPGELGAPVYSSHYDAAPLSVQTAAAPVYHAYSEPQYGGGTISSMAPQYHAYSYEGHLISPVEGYEAHASGSGDANYASGSAAYVAGAAPAPGEGSSAAREVDSYNPGDGKDAYGYIAPYSWPHDTFEHNHSWTG